MAQTNFPKKVIKVDYVKPPTLPLKSKEIPSYGTPFNWTKMATHHVFTGSERFHIISRNILLPQADKEALYITH